MDPYLHVWDVDAPKATPICALVTFLGMVYFQFQFWRIKRHRKAREDDPGA